MNIVEPIARQALAFPDRHALVSDGSSMTYSDLIHRVTRMARQLQRAGVGRGDIVGITTNAFLPQIVAPLAVAWIGAISMPIAQRDAGTARDYGVKLIVYHLEGSSMPEIPDVQVLSVAELRKLDDGQLAPLSFAEPETIWRIAVSSGTTGRPKAVSHSHGATILRSQLSRLIYPHKGDSPERLMIVMGYGITFAVSYWLRTLTGGGTLVRFSDDMRETMELLRSERVSMVVAGPNNAMLLSELATEEGSPWTVPPPSLQTLCVGGAAISPGVQQSLRKFLCPKLGINYGSTETGAVAVLDDEVRRSHPGSAGRLLPWVEVRIVDDNNESLPFGSVGRIAVRSPGLASSYVRPAGEVGNPQAGEAFVGGWFKTSDRGRLTMDGALFLSGRESEILNIGGNKVDASLVEEVIARDPVVTECAVLAMQKPSGVQLMVALVVSDAQVVADEVRRRCIEALGLHMTPAAVIQVQRLPRNNGGKVVRKDLPALAVRAIASAAQAGVGAEAGAGG